MSRTALIITILVLGATTAAGAGTFTPAPYLAEEGVPVLTKTVANEQLDRDLFGAPYATVVVGNVDVYDRFPYVEARYFQIVSDPAWNRLLMGEMGRNLAAFDGEGSAFGHLASPRGLSGDALGHVFVADTGNDRVLVFRASSEYDDMTLVPLYAIEGLSKPYDVAYSDGGTPFDAGDDRLYVANTGRNEVRRYALDTNGARLTHALGELGSGDRHFAGPMALVAGRRDGANTGEIYVSDAHNGRLVRLRDTGGALAWDGSLPHALGLVTSLDTDHFGNVYAAAPQAGTVTKFTSDLFPVARYTGATQRPRSFHVPFANVTDHRTGARQRAGQGSGLVVEEWGGQSGLRMVNLGVELTDAAQASNETNAVRVTLTDQAAVSAELVDPRSGRVIARHDAGTLGAGVRVIRFEADDFVAQWSEGDYRVSIKAHSTYDESRSDETETTLALSGAGGPVLPQRLTLLGNTPNPFNPSTMIRFLVPAGTQRDYSLRVYDVAGRLVRNLGEGRIDAGLHEVPWDGRDGRGTPVSSGVYLYRLAVGAEALTGKMVLIK